MTIIGVAGDVKQSGLNQPVDPAVYTPFVQSDEVWRHWMTLAIRTDNSSSGLVEEVKAQVWSVDRQIPVSDVRTMDQLMVGVACTAAVQHAPPRSFCGSRADFGWRWNLWRNGLYRQPANT
jgi:hypothetical protein